MLNLILVKILRKEINSFLIYFAFFFWIVFILISIKIEIINATIKKPANTYNVWEYEPVESFTIEIIKGPTNPAAAHAVKI